MHARSAALKRGTARRSAKGLTIRLSSETVLPYQAAFRDQAATLIRADFSTHSCPRRAAKTARRFARIVDWGRTAIGRQLECAIRGNDSSVCGIDKTTGQKHGVLSNFSPSRSAKLPDQLLLKLIDR